MKLIDKPLTELQKRFARLYVEAFYGHEEIEEKNGINISGLNSRVTGSAALDLAYVGSGRFDGYFQNNLNLWDIAAGSLIVKEAGGTINDIDYSKIENINVRASSNNIFSKMNEKIVRWN